MDELLSIDQYQAMVGESFHIATHGVDLTLERVDIVLINERLETFSLIFSGKDRVFLSQATYNLAGKRGKFDIFLVPVAKTSSGYEYEAVFNRIKKHG